MHVIFHFVVTRSKRQKVKIPMGIYVNRLIAIESVLLNMLARIWYHISTPEENAILSLKKFHILYAIELVVIGCVL